MKIPSEYDKQCFEETEKQEKRLPNKRKKDKENSADLLKNKKKF